MKSDFFLNSIVAAFRLSFMGLVAIGCLAFPTAALAKEGDTFLCTIKAGGVVEEFFPEVVGIKVGSDTTETLVIDPIINYYYGDPIQAKLIADNDARLSLRWVVKFTAESGRTVISLRYDLMILKKDMSARMRTLNSVGDSREFTAPGTCEPAEW